LNKPKLLFLDIETFPNLGWTWAKYEQDVIKFKQETCIATFAAKWQHGPVFAKALPDYKGYKPGSYDDKKLVVDLHKLLDEADVIIAHNGVDFDVKVINARFLFHGLKPPSPYKVIDTKREVKKVARFNSNKLDDLGSLLGEGKKIKTDFDLWLGCIHGEKDSWDRMVRYNKQDVLLLEKVYLRLRPWIKSHPNLTVLNPEANCPKCESTRIQWRGTTVTATRKYARFQCQDCGGWGRATKGAKGTTVVSQ
jgi:DNA polymerase elongation subunit (family B)